jgi:exonuclease SbcD
VKVAIVADTHADETRGLDDHDRIMAWTVDDAAERGCELMLHAGDVWERRSTPRERRSVADWTQYAASRCPLVVVAGNHDDPLDIEWLGRLRSDRGIQSVVAPHVVRAAGLAIAALPWPRKGGVLGASESRDQADAVARQGLGSILAGMGACSPDILLAHVMLRGSRTSVSQPPLVGQDLELGLDDLGRANAGLYALGHIHLHQTWEIDGAPVAYPGSPRRCNYGETETKGYIVAERGPDGTWRLEHVPTPTAPMVHVDVEYVPGTGYTLGAVEQGSDVRVRYSVAAEHREAARAAAEAYRDRLLAAGAARVTLEARTVVQRTARAPQVARANTVAEQLGAYWTASDGPPGADRPRLLGRVAALESEVRS